jgi:uncharacterized protein (TIGR02271 family)
MRNDTSQIQPGWEVIDDLGEKIGDVQDVQSDYVLITKGLIFPKDLYIPRDAIQRVDQSEERVILNVRKGGIDETQWSEAPVAGSYQGGTMDAGTVGTEDEAVLTVKEEQLRAETARTQTGEVAVGKRVVDQQVDMDVPVTRDEVEVTRRRVDRPADGSEMFTEDEGTIRVPITSEEVNVSKEPRVVEEVVVSKRPVTETQRVSETVRREEVDVEETGTGGLRSDAATQRRDTYAQANTGSSGGDDDDLAGLAGGGAAGAVGGAAVGAAVGGPPGAVVGGLVGAAGGAAAGDVVEDEVEGDDPR